MLAKLDGGARYIKRIHRPLLCFHVPRFALDRPNAMKMGKRLHQWLRWCSAVNRDNLARPHKSCRVEKGV